MNTDEFSKKYREGNVYIISGPLEHWMTPYHILYGDFTNADSEHLKNFKKGDVFLFYVSSLEKLDSQGFKWSNYRTGIIGLGIFSRKGYRLNSSFLGLNTGSIIRRRKRIWTYKDTSSWPHRLLFSTVILFKKGKTIRDIEINIKNTFFYLVGEEKLSSKLMSLEEMTKIGDYPFQSPVVKLSDVEKGKLLPLIIKRLASYNPITITDSDEAKKIKNNNNFLSITEINSNTPIPIKARVQEETEEVKSEFITNFRLQPYIQKNNFKASSRIRQYVDFENKNQRNLKTGNKGEEMVLKSEKEFLNKLGRMDLANKVKRISLEDTSAGYDILSFDSEGGEKLIEVKATVLPKRRGFSFNMSSNEIKFAEKSSNFYIYLVFDVNGQSPKIATIKNPFSLGLLVMEPTQYIIRGNTE